MADNRARMASAMSNGVPLLSKQQLGWDALSHPTTEARAA
jgi:hypothetical protein